MPSEVTADDKALFSQAFIIFDRNGDGTVDATEFKEALKVLGREISDEDLKAIMGGEKCNHEQFVTALSNMKNGTPNQKEVLDALAVFDKGDGTVSASELKNAMLNMGQKPLSESECDALLKQADVNGDGSIQYESWVTSTMNQTLKGTL